MFEDLMPTAVGGAAAIVGVWVGHYWQSREARQVRDEAFAREDQYRLHRDRLQAYHDFYTAAGRARRAITVAGPDGAAVGSGHRAWDERSDLWHGYTRVELIGADSVVRAARRVLDIIDGVVIRGEPYDDERWLEGIREYARIARSDIVRSDSP